MIYLDALCKPRIDATSVAVFQRQKTSIKEMTQALCGQAALHHDHALSHRGQPSSTTHGILGKKN
jgi:hypothetical protein